MAVTRVFTVEAAQITDGAANEVTDADNEDHVIEKIKVIDEDGNLGAVSDVTIQVSGNSITDQVIPLFDTDTWGPAGVELVLAVQQAVTL